MVEGQGWYEKPDHTGIAPIHHAVAVRGAHATDLRAAIKPNVQNFLSKNDIWDKYSEELLRLSKKENLDEWDELNRKYHKERQEWEQKVLKAVSLGHITMAEAEKLGWSHIGLGGAKVTTLPQQLFHVTTNKDAVIRTGLKTRDELQMESGSGLGGGGSDTVSFTESIEIARNIYNVLIEAQKIASGKITVNDLIEQAEEGIGASRPWYNDLEHYISKSESGLMEKLFEGKTKQFSFGFKTIEEINKEELALTKWRPIGEAHIWNGESRYNQFERDLTQAEKRERLFRFYKLWLAFREKAGGAEDPLFFLNDVDSLANIKPNQIAILEFTPKPNAHGYQAGALGEWRTFTGEAVGFRRKVG